MSESPAPSAPRLPLFFNRLEPLQATRHGTMRLRHAGFGFARAATGIPVAAEEFGAASRTVPIVFMPDAPYMPVALTALVPGQSHTVGPDGSWKQGVYVPAYVRRYPFLLARSREGSDEMTLCIDPSAKALGTTEGEALFADGKPTPVTDRALEFARNYEVAMQRTQAMVSRLEELELLQPGAVQFQLDGKQRRVDGFRAVDRQRLERLPAENFMELRDRGYLEPIYAHLLSIGGLPELTREAG